MLLLTFVHIVLKFFYAEDRCSKNENRGCW